MKINKFNHEGYYDPTAYEAMMHIVKEAKKTAFRPIVFICSPYADDVVVNVKNARRYCRFAVKQNYIPFAPHLFFPQFMDDSIEQQRNLGLYFGIIFLSKCAEIWVFGENNTKGMSIEIEKARNLKLPIRYFSSKCEEFKFGVRRFFV
ncbi:MAG: DUF7768 domain-containing protein [Eubacteriales bacterium]